MPPKRNQNASAAASANTTDSQVVMDAQNSNDNALPPVNQTAMVAIPPLSKNAMAARIGVPPLGQNAMPVPPLTQNAMAAPIG
eukprot:648557-Rhodomonas_salina.1